MDRIIDCFFIGHNEMNFAEYEQEVRKMGIHLGVYRDLNLNFIQYNNRPYSAPDIFNLFYLAANHGAEGIRPFSLGEAFNAAIAYLGTYLNRRGLSFDFVNSFQDHKEELSRKLKQGDIRTIAIITTLYVSVFPILEIMDFIRTYNRSASIILGGPFVSTRYRTIDPESLKYLFKSIDADFYVVSSQGEAALVNIINALKNNLPLDRVNNIYYKSNNGYISTPMVEEDNDLSQNMVDWCLFASRVGEHASVRTSISCPFSCAFCGFPQYAGKYRLAEIEAVEAELKQLADIESLKSLNFIDDTFNVPPKRFKQILRVIEKNRFQFKWNSHFRCQFADRETVELMKASGCEGVFLGIESGSEKILKNMNKAAAVDQYLKGIALLKEFDILTYGSFIIGFPGETEKTVEETVKFIKESGLDYYRAQLWYCDAITPIWKRREDFKIEGSNFEWSHATMDARRACDLIEEIFLTIDDPLWVPQYNFEFNGMFYLIHRGFTRQEFDRFVKSFNNGIKEKLLNPAQKEIGFQAIMRLKDAVQRDGGSGDLKAVDGDKIDRSAVGFDF